MRIRSSSSRPARIEARKSVRRLADGQKFLQRRFLELDAGLGTKARAERLATVEHFAATSAA